MYRKDACSIQIQMEEGDATMEEEVDSAKVETTKDSPTNKTSTIDKMLQTCEGCFVDGEAIMPDQANRTIHWSKKEYDPEAEVWTGKG